MGINSPPELRLFTFTIMAEINELGKFRVPIGNQEIELQQIDHVDGGLPANGQK